jgi:hypothetical protein
METNKIIFSVLAIVVVAGYAFFLNEEPTKTSPEPVSGNNYGNINKPVYMAGCRTFDRPVEPVVVYPTVRKNFVTLLCALEVFPPYGIFALQKREQAEKKAQ